MTRVLVAAGAAVNTPNHYGITPLLQASRSGDAADRHVDQKRAPTSRRRILTARRR
jgi:ankyrin repeat protein